MAIKKKYYLGVDIGGTKISAGLVDKGGRIVSVKKTSTPANGAASQIYSQVRKVISELLRNRGVAAGELFGIGVGVPGIVKPNHRDILRTPNVRLSRYPLAANLKKAFCAKILLGNDVNLGLLGEKWAGAAKGVENVIGIFPGTGVGGAIIIGGKLIYGAQGGAGELGHMILDLNSLKKSAGISGSLEALAGRRAIEREIRGRIRKGARSVIPRLQGKGLATIKSGVLAEALKRKDGLTAKVIHEVCEALGKACISLRHVLNPEMIVLGGGLIEACGKYMLPRIRKISNSDPFFKGIDRCAIEQSVLGDDAIILGAVALLKQAGGGRTAGDIEYYPHLSADKRARVFVDSALVKGSLYIRADGKPKPITHAGDFGALKKRGVLGLGAVKKICKKKPKVLIVGSLRRRLKTPQSVKEFLAKKDILLRRLSLKEAVKAYNAAGSRKALVIFRHN